MPEKRGQQYKLSNSIIKKIDLLMLELPKSGISKTKGKFFRLVKNFFKEYLEINSEFTASELPLLIPEKSISAEQKELLIDLVRTFEEKEYSPDGFSEDDLKKTMLTFRKFIVDLMGHTDSVEPEKNISVLVKWHNFCLRLRPAEHAVFFQELYKALEHLEKGEIGIAKEIVRSLLEIYAQMPAAEKKKLFPEIGKLTKKIAAYEINDSQRIVDDQIDKVHRLSEKDSISSAKEAYKELKESYDTLPLHIKKKYYYDIDLCFRIIKKKEYSALRDDIVRIIGETKLAVSNREDNIAQDNFRQIEDKFSKLDEKNKKSLKQKVDDIYLEVYSERR